MVHNFESWRKSTQEKHRPDGVSHYHLCSDLAFYAVAELLKSLCVSFVERRQMKVRQEQIDNVLLFLDEMQFAYLHPRSSSARLACRMETSATH